MTLAGLQRLFKTKGAGKTLKNVRVKDRDGNVSFISDVKYDSEDDVVYIILQ